MGTCCVNWVAGASAAGRWPKLHLSVRRDSTDTRARKTWQAHGLDELLKTTHFCRNGFPGLLSWHLVARKCARTALGVPCVAESELLEVIQWSLNFDINTWHLYFWHWHTLSMKAVTWICPRGLKWLRTSPKFWWDNSRDENNTLLSGWTSYRKMIRIAAAWSKRVLIVCRERVQH